MEAEHIRDLVQHETEVVAALERTFTALVLGVEQRIDAIAVGDIAGRDEAEAGLSQVLGALIALTEERIKVRRAMDAAGVMQPAAQRQ